MDKLKAIEAFTRIVELGTLTAAADAMHVSLPTVVRMLSALERDLDVRLLNRTTRKISLTDEGRDYHERCRRMLADLAEAEASLSARRSSPRGALRLTSSVMFGRQHVAPILTDFILRHPAVRANILLLDRAVNLVEEGLDVAVRIGKLPDSSLVAIPIGSSRRVTCASPAYLREAPPLATPADLAGHRCVSSGGATASTEWTFRGDSGQELAARVQPSFMSNQISVALDASVRGIGVGQFLHYQVQALIESGQLVVVLPDHEPAPLPINVLYPQTRRVSTTVRAFLSWCVPRLRDRLRA